jgi:hypothetical protein
MTTCGPSGQAPATAAAERPERNHDCHRLAPCCIAQGGSHQLALDESVLVQLLEWRQTVGDTYGGPQARGNRVQVECLPTVCLIF